MLEYILHVVLFCSVQPMSTRADPKAPESRPHDGLEDMGNSHPIPASYAPPMFDSGVATSGGGPRAQATHDRRIESMMAQISRQLALLTQTVQIFEDRLRVVEAQVQGRGDDHHGGATTDSMASHE